MLWELMSGEEAWLGLSNETIISTVAQQKTQLKFKEEHPAPYTVCSAIVLPTPFSSGISWEHPAPSPTYGMFISYSKAVFILLVMSSIWVTKPIKSDFSSMLRAAKMT